MKKRMHIKITTALAICMLACLLISGCNNIASNETNTIAGTWKATVPVGDTFIEVLSDIKTGASMDYFDFSTLSIDVTMIFTANGILTTELDDDSIVTMATSLKSIIYDGLQNYLDDLVEEIDMNITAEDLLRLAETETGVTIDSIIHKAINEATIAEHLKQRLNYKVEKGKLYTWADGETPDNTRYVIYEIKDENLLLKEYVAPNNEKKGLGIIRAVLPVEFYRVL